MLGFFVLTFFLAALADEVQRPQCLMEPRYLTMKLPERGLVWLEGQEFPGSCDPVTPTGWMRSPSKEFDLLVHADGPSGSGRFWTVTVGVTGKGKTGPGRGFCLETSTAGWRTLQDFQKSPLPWIEDQDSDGTGELIIWDSFPLSGEASSAESGLVAWVYRLDPKGGFEIDWSLSRKLAGDLAAAYRTPLMNDPEFQGVRDRVAEALNAFATEGCATGTAPP
ncbi:MAG TPA: hypothetical protein VMS98_17750 [Thermoanaerobaculia bacterium]|nr:hypothetical protein [Thermoanaerobaculia bacterium]